jgi:hypothetical protein
MRNALIVFLFAATATAADLPRYRTVRIDVPSDPGLTTLVIRP